MYTVLAASSSEYRRWWYRDCLTHNGFDVRISENAMQCLTQMRLEMPDVLILETSLLWGGADGVLDVLASDRTLVETRTLLVAVKNNAAEIYRVCRHAVDDVLTPTELEGRLVDHLIRLLRCGKTRPIPVSVCLQLAH